MLMYAMRKGPVYARTLETTECAGYKLPEAALVPPLVSSLPPFVSVPFQTGLDFYKRDVRLYCLTRMEFLIRKKSSI